MRRNNKYLILVIAMSLCLVGCGEKNVSPKDVEETDEIVVDTKAQIESALDTIENMKGEEFEKVALQEDYTKIKLNGNSVKVNGSGVNVGNNVVTITSGGCYYITGILENGQIIVDSGKNNVTLLLDNAQIKSETSSAIYVKSAKNTVIELNDKSLNYVEDATTYQNEDDCDSAIFSNDDLYITGSGVLNVKANFNDGIKSKDDFSVLSGNIVIDSVDDGIVGKDSVSVKNGNIKITAGGDGIKSTNDEDDAKGYVAIENGTFDITAQADGIQAETNINIANGTFKINTGDGIEVNNDSDMRKLGGENQNPIKEDTQSAKGLKAEKNVTIMSGTFDINSSDDAIHCNNNVVISGGDINIVTGDDGIHADNFLSIVDGKITVEKSYEGLEASLIEIKDGDISIVASDDGINVAGGSDSSSMNGRMGQNKFSSNTSNYLSIEGGNIFVNASGDGLDANGSIYIKGGNIEVAGPISNGDGALDFDGECVVTGGEIVAYGSSGMSQKPSSSTQCVITINGSYNENDKLEIVSGDDVIYNCVLKKKCQSIIISSCAFEKNSECYLKINDNIVETFNLSDIFTNIGERAMMNMEKPGREKSGGRKPRLDETKFR